MKNVSHKIWDVIIVGGGPAGCNAAVVLARCRRNVLMIDEGNQRNIKSHGMHNYLTRDDIAVAEYLSIIKEELEKYNVTIKRNRVIQIRKLEEHGFEVTDKNGKEYLCRRILLATGVTDNIPNIPGMHELWGCGVYHCPYCDGWEYRDKTIGIYSKINNGYGMAIAMHELSDKIILFTDGAKYLRSKQIEHLKACNIQLIDIPIKTLIYPYNKLKSVELVNNDKIICDAIFINEGHRINNILLQQLNCNATKMGAAITNRYQQTNIPGVYVAGDASYDMHFVVVAAAEGAKAAVAIHNGLLQTDNPLYRY